MHETGKTMTWTRWAVKIDAQHPPSTYAMLHEFLKDGPRFKVVAMGCTETQVRAVVEYTAKGANADHIKRKFTMHGIPRHNVETINVASVETEWKFNHDLVAVIDQRDEEVAA